ncbi:uncharacterized protein LOC131604710 [Vicia villosa]|uniref:uncharacterized protein LOC131604710 n=1 Tax=Vicia villosa TaxID=3911 RepID=UPI00273C87BC|nr:uncharacterized protein LOC131604710 [Vicia villosa]
MIAKSASEEEHVGHLLKLFQRLRKYKLRLNPSKCTFGVRSRKLLGFIVSQRGIEVDPDKVKAILEMPPPKTEKQVSDVIKYMSNWKMHSRIGKWVLALTEYSLAFMPLKSMKGQVVSDFIVDHAVVENPQLYVELKPWRLFFDGSTHKEGSGVGILLISPNGIPIKFKYRIEGPLCSNNEAEYEALIVGLEALLELGQPRLLNFFEYVDIKHVPRIKNQEENDLAQIASGYRISKEKLEELVEVRGKVMATRLSPRDLENTQLGYANKEEFKVLAIDTLIDTDWRSPILNYLKNLSIDTERKIKYIALSYVLMETNCSKSLSKSSSDSRACGFLPDDPSVSASSAVVKIFHASRL